MFDISNLTIKNGNIPYSDKEIFTTKTRTIAYYSEESDDDSVQFNVDEDNDNNIIVSIYEGCELQYMTVIDAGQIEDNKSLENIISNIFVKLEKVSEH